MISKALNEVKTQIFRMKLHEAAPEGNTSSVQKNPSLHSILLGNADKKIHLLRTDYFAHANVCEKNDD